ncbi:hypothetical protein L798_03242 [Zootermopsis nevadensis]|uniref:Uncharacterized protein n=1 Tax=Zootermopsis nevadensis TaxID=136037 RepID=A0A067QGR9_ZOONE|nr:hypothetical protein L798_03242 [Zootermopsis nevadensis]
MRCLAEPLLDELEVQRHHLPVAGRTRRSLQPRRKLRLIRQEPAWTMRRLNSASIQLVLSHYNFRFIYDIERQIHLKFNVNDVLLFYGNRDGCFHRSS